MHPIPPPRADNDPFRLARFVEAQASDHAVALAELRAGHKRSHWIWYVLPQLRGLGTSRLSDYYGIASLDEARAYLAHPVLGPRLAACVRAIGSHPPHSADKILGPLDAAKYRSCLTLFKQAAPSDALFAEALVHSFAGQEDQQTLRRLGAASGPHLER